MTQNEDWCAADISKGDGKPFFRYLIAYYTFGGIPAVTKVWLSNTKNTTEGDARTRDLNKGRGGNFVYLCWDYEKDCEY